MKYLQHLPTLQTVQSYSVQLATAVHHTTNKSMSLWSAVMHVDVTHNNIDSACTGIESASR